MLFWSLNVDFDAVLLTSKNRIKMFAHDVTVAMLLSKNTDTQPYAGHMMSKTIPVAVEP